MFSKQLWNQILEERVSHIDTASSLNRAHRPQLYFENGINFICSIFVDSSKIGVLHQKVTCYVHGLRLRNTLLKLSSENQARRTQSRLRVSLCDTDRPHRAGLCTSPLKLIFSTSARSNTLDLNEKTVAPASAGGIMPVWRWKSGDSGQSLNPLGPSGVEQELGQAV